MTAIKIHGVPPSTFTRTVRLACHEKGIDYELVPTMPGEITALNPFRKIPAVSHGDLVLFETTAILRYLDRTFAGPKLWPDDLVGIALCDQWVSAVCDLLVNAALRYMASRYGFLPVPAEMQRQYLDKTREVVPIFDRQLGKTRYLAGDGVTAADLFRAGPVLLPRHCRAPRHRRCSAQLRALGARHGRPAERQGHRAAAQAAARRLRKDTPWQPCRSTACRPAPSPAPSGWPAARRASTTSWCRRGRAKPRPLNPLGKIPMMKHGDFMLYELPAIARYVDRTFDGPPLWPKDARGRRRSVTSG